MFLLRLFPPVIIVSFSKKNSELWQVPGWWGLVSPEGVAAAAVVGKTENTAYFADVLIVEPVVLLDRHYW